MDDHVRPPEREHHFYVSTAKFLFYHPQHGIVAVRDPIRLVDAERHGLSPIILYGLTVAGLPIRWLTFSTVGRPRTFREVLLTAWRGAEGLRGLPDILRVNRYLAQADPALAADIAKIGVRLEVANAKDKTVPASLRSAQDAAGWLTRRHEPVDPSLAAYVEALGRDAHEDHDWKPSRGSRGLSNRKLEEKIERWLALPMRQPEYIPFEEADWKAGPWLSSWETSLPPDRPRYFHQDSFSGRAWLLLGENPPEDIDDDEEVLVYQERDNAAEIAKNLVACWPNSPKEIAAAAEITLRQLQWFTSARSALDRSARLELERLLGIEYDERVGRYTATGPYALIAKKAQSLEAIYQDISGGGDACPCEIVPANGAADPSWRYVLINAYGTPPTLVMAPRGEAITERLPDLMINHEGIRSVSPALYRDVVSTCARACQTPKSNTREMRDFARRHERQWVDCVWLPD